MKKLFIYTLFFISILYSCKKDEQAVADRSTIDQGLLQQLSQQSMELTVSNFGWKAYLFTSAGAGFSFYMDFDTTRQVHMYADLGPDQSALSAESSYLINLEGIPSLFFNSSNYMYGLSKTGLATFGGKATWAPYSDFEFNFNKQSGDTLFLNGKLLESKLILVKATAAEQQSFQSKGLYNSIQSSVTYIRNNPYLYLNLGDETKIQTSFNYFSKVFSMTWEDGGIIHNQSSAFAFTLNGILLQNPLTYKNKTIKEFYWDTTISQLFAIVDGQRVYTQVSPTPVLPLHTLFGIYYRTIIVPSVSTYPGWSTDFISRRANVAAIALSGSYRLRLDRLVFTFSTSSPSLIFSADIYQGTSKFLANFPYKYTKTAAGVYKFIPGAMTGNAMLIGESMAPLTSERLDTDNFKLDFLVHPQTGQLLGQFQSIQHPDFAFSGTVQ
ncbi:DUF4302 domain-containing protein [Pedobacter sp. AW31-3R]|uniref:DUF4302 domain-containing protein n=1 Tax=Pedobacter sp. AW31-3R TaxID=3445781 RepID=UPI003FA13EC7